MVKELVDGFLQRFDPALPEAERAAGTEKVKADQVAPGHR